MTGVETSPFARVVDALRRHGSVLRASGEGYQAQCPSHDDRSPSLSVHPGHDRDGRDTALLCCQAGCEVATVLSALGLRPADLFVPRERSGNTGVEEVYSYRDQDRVERFQKVRKPGKAIRYRHRGVNGEWIWKRRPGEPPTLYMLPELIDGIAAGRRVWLCEGEKDVDRLTALGEIAVSSEHGASKPPARPKWFDSYNAWFTGAHVTIIADNDEPGHAHARHAASRLAGVAASVRVVRGAVDQPKFDVSDHLDAGFTLDDLVVLPDAKTNGHRPGPIDLKADDSDETPIRRLQPLAASEVTMRRTRWLWENRIPLGGLTLLAGREGLGKSSLAVSLAAQVTRGEMAGEMLGTPSTVIYINSEDSREFTIVPRLVAAGADLSRVFFIDALTPDDELDAVVMPLDTERLADTVTEIDAKLVVLDAATSVIDSRLDGDKDRQMRRALEAIASKVGEATGAAVLGIVHFGKRESSDVGKLILGTVAWSQVARSTMAIALDTDTGNLVLTGSKANLAPMDTSSLLLRIEPATVDTPEGPTSVGRAVWLGDTDTDARDLLDGGEGLSDRAERNEARDWLRDYLGQGRCKSSDVKRAATAAGISERTLQRARGILKVMIKPEGFPRVTYWALPAWQDCGDSDAMRSTASRAGEQGGITVSTDDDLHKCTGTTVGTTVTTTGTADEWHNWPAQSGATEPSQSCHENDHGTTVRPGSYASGDSGATCSPGREEHGANSAHRRAHGVDSSHGTTSAAQSPDEPDAEPGGPGADRSAGAVERVDPDGDRGTPRDRGDGRPGGSVRDTSRTTVSDTGAAEDGAGLGGRDAPSRADPVVEGPVLVCRRCGRSDTRTMTGLTLCAMCAYGVPDDGGDHLDRWPVIPPAE